MAVLDKELTGQLERPSQLAGSRVRLLLIGATLASLVIHLPFAIFGSFGEQDAARLVNYAVAAAESGAFRNADYSLRSSPLYLDTLRFLFASGVLARAQAPAAMALASLLAAGLAAGLLAVFTLRLSGSLRAAVGACLLFLVTPVIWFNSIYGFPTMVAIAFFMAALVLFQQGIEDGGAGVRIACLAAAAVLFVLSVLVKLDMVLASAAFCLPVWTSNRSLASKLLWSLALAGVAALAFFAANWYGQSLAPQQGVFQWNDFDARFPSRVEHLVSAENITIIARAVGVLSLAVAVVAGVALVRDPRRRTMLWWLLAAIAPLMLYWGLKSGNSGNSARHNLVPAVLLCVLLALPLAGAAWRRWAAVLLVMVVVNYFFFGPETSTVAPSGRLLPSARLIEARVASLHETGAALAALPGEQIAVVGQGSKQPYFWYEVAKRAGAGEAFFADQMELAGQGKLEIQRLELRSDSRGQSIVWFYRPPDAGQLAALVDQGYFLAVTEQSIADQLAGLPALDGHWTLIGE